MQQEQNKTSTYSRRTIAKSAAWAVPTIALATAPPAFAASPCINVTMSWGAASNTKLTNGTVYRISASGSRTVYAQVTYTESAQQTTRTQQYQLKVGKTAFGRQVGSETREYAVNTTGGGNDLILNQLAGGGTTSVSIKFFSDAALTKPTTVQNLQVPLDDFSTQRTYELGWSGLQVQPARSYQEMWSVVGSTTTGSVTPVKTRLESAYSSNSRSTLANVSGSGTTTSPWTFPTSLTDSGRNSVGGNLITTFGTPVTGVTVNYSSSTDLTGPQGAGLGRLSMCI